MPRKINVWSLGAKVPHIVWPGSVRFYILERLRRGPATSREVVDYVLTCRSSQGSIIRTQIGAMRDIGYTKSRSVDALPWPPDMPAERYLTAAGT